MQRELVRLEPAMLDAIAHVDGSGAMAIETGRLARVISGVVDTAAVRIGVSSSD